MFATIRYMTDQEHLVANLCRAVVKNVAVVEEPMRYFDVDDFTMIDPDDSPIIFLTWPRQTAPRVFKPYQPGPWDSVVDRKALAERIWTFVCDVETQDEADEITSRIENLLESRDAVARSSFLDRARRLGNVGQTDAALDIIFDQIDELLLSRDFARVDELLSTTLANDLSADLLLGILTATLPAKSHLVQRTTFYEQVEAALRERGELEDDLLVGLE
jgi:hypothetical protein